ncbi:MAG: hypothetical protein ABEH88_10170 [Halobacteriales archaeon]
MIEGIPAPTVLQAALLLVVVFGEAVVLYVGYGYAERAIAPRVLGRIGNT